MLPPHFLTVADSERLARTESNAKEFHRGSRESKTLTAARIRKETALSQSRELQLAERGGTLVDSR